MNLRGEGVHILEGRVFTFMCGQLLALNNSEVGILDKEPKNPISFGCEAPVSLLMPRVFLKLKWANLFVQ